MKINSQQNLYPAYKLGWDIVSKVLSIKISNILGRAVYCQARWEDMDYWGVSATGYQFTIAEIQKLMHAMNTDAKACPDALPEDGESSRSIGMELSELLLQDALKATWECERYTQDEIWLINYQHQSCDNTNEDDIYQLPGESIAMRNLSTRGEVLTYLAENGSTYAALMDSCEKYQRKWKNKLCWPYPISDGRYYGMFLVLVREGVMSLPYEEVERESGEIFKLADAKLCDAEALSVLLNDWRTFDLELQSAMQSMLDLIRRKEVSHGQKNGLDDSLLCKRVL